MKNKLWKHLLTVMLMVLVLSVSVVCASANGQCPEGHELVDGTYCEECGCDYEWWVRQNGDNCENEGHDWDMGVCIVCGTKRCDVEGHKWNNGECSVCYIQCDHFWTDRDGNYHTYCNSTGKCSICGASHPHSLEYGRCTECYYTCNHSWSAWSNGKRTCSTCGAEETCSNHSWSAWSNGKRTCSTCGAEETCDHSWSTWHNSQRSCSTCGVEETCSNHSWSAWSSSRRSCSTCDAEEYCNDHSFDNGVCTICNAQCNHFWHDAQNNYHSTCSGDGECQKCGVSHEHDWVNKNGVCKVCYYTCGHRWSTWSNSQRTCSICGVEETCSEHSWGDWSNGKRNCTTCGAEDTCSHPSWSAWNNSQHSCSICQTVETCGHSWGDWNDSQRSCTICGAEETCDEHNYSNGYCSICSKACDHQGNSSFWKGACTLCGAPCPHEGHWNNGLCMLCTLVCPHTDQDGNSTMSSVTGTCSICSKACDHKDEYGGRTYDNGVCTQCGKACSHNWGDWMSTRRICNTCGTVEYCSHNWTDSTGSMRTCSICGETCYNHNYSNETGKCTFCGKECEHRWGDWIDSKRSCEVCGMEETCEHSWSDWSNSKRTCSICDAEDTCEHSWSDWSNSKRTCSTCGAEETCSVHNWEFGICSICKAVCTHQWSSSGGCSICYTSCTHSWGTDGKCTICGMTCWHIYWDNGKCSDCGMACPGHSWDENGQCENCYLVCEHTSGWTNGKCSLCGLDCTHNYGTAWKNGSCTVCGVSCPHASWNSNTGKCNLCQYECQHPGWSESKCSTCGKACDHDKWEEDDDGLYVCTTCGWPCYHDNWNSEDGTCTFCGYPCPHEMGGSDSKHSAWYDGVCYVCKLVCTHEWDSERCECKICKTVQHNLGEDGVCTKCGWYQISEPCSHEYATNEDGTLGTKCTKCGEECAHLYDWNGGYCRYCQTEMAIPADLYATAGTPFPVSNTQFNYVFFRTGSEGAYYQVTATGNDDWELNVYTVAGKKHLGYATNVESVLNAIPDAGSSVLFYADAGASYVIKCNNFVLKEANFSILITKSDVQCTEHSWKNGVCQTCLKNCKHDYQDVSGSDSRTCTVCNATCNHLETQKNYLTSVDGTPVKAGTHVVECSVCGKRTVTDCDYYPMYYPDDLTLYCDYCKAPMQTADLQAGETGATVRIGQYSFFKFVPTASAVYAIRAEHACMPQIKLIAWSGAPLSRTTANEGGVCESEYYMFEGETYYLILITPAGNYDSANITLTVTQTDHTCQHIYNEFNMCKYCGADNPNACEEHSWVNGVCTVCTAECLHSQGWNGEIGACFTCRKACEHLWNADGMCLLCVYWCRHQEYSDESGLIVYWKNGVCEICKKECQHDFTGDGYCKNGCDVKNADHDHTWESDGSGKCSICQVECSHYLGDWVDGVCQTCGKACDHYWLGGCCMYCEKACTAVDDGDGTCVNCGDPLYTVTVSNTSGARLSGGGVYHEWAHATITAEAKAGYTFNGWYIGDNKLTSNLSYSDYITKDLEFTAKYTANASFNVTITGPGFYVDGYTAVQTQVVAPYPAGTVLTITAKESDRVSAWYNGYGKVLSTGSTLTVTVTGAMTITLSYKNNTEGSAIVRYYSDFDQLIAMGTYTWLDTVTPPAGPSRTGYTFLDWSLAPEEIKALIESGETEITVKPVYEATGDAYTINITWDPDGWVDSITDIPAGTQESITAKEYDGMTFSYWTDDLGNVLSYSPTIKVFVNDDLNLVAYYDYDVTVQPVTTMNPPKAFQDGGKNKVSFTMLYDVPEDYTLVEAGIIRSTSVSGDDLTIDNDSTAVKRYVSNSKAAQGSYTATIVVGNSTDLTIYARGYIIFQEAATGNNFTYYSDEVSGSYNSLQ